MGLFVLCCVAVWFKPTPCLAFFVRRQNPASFRRDARIIRFSGNSRPRTAFKSHRSRIIDYLADFLPVSAKRGIDYLGDFLV